VYYYDNFLADEIIKGLIWFWVPASLVICNDIFAYIWGMVYFDKHDTLFIYSKESPLGAPRSLNYPPRRQWKVSLVLSSVL